MIKWLKALREWSFLVWRVGYDGKRLTMAHAWEIARAMYHTRRRSA